jgi:hypothetical protein
MKGNEKVQLHVGSFLFGQAFLCDCLAKTLIYGVHDSIDWSWSDCESHRLAIQHEAPNEPDIFLEMAAFTDHLNKRWIITLFAFFLIHEAKRGKQLLLGYPVGKNIVEFILELPFLAILD